MKTHITTLFLALFFWSTAATAQNALPANYESVDVYTKQVLQATAWHCEDYQVWTGSGFWNQAHPFTLRFLGNQQFIIENGKAYYKGKYTVTEEAIIDFQIAEEQKAELEAMPRERYVITKLTDDQLYLTHYAPESDQPTHFYRMVSDAYRENIEERIQAHKAAREARGTTIPETSSEIQRTALLARIEGVRKAKNLEISNDIHKMTNEELQKYLEEIY